VKSLCGVQQNPDGTSWDVGWGLTWIDVWPNLQIAWLTEIAFRQSIAIDYVPGFYHNNESVTALSQGK